MYTIYIYDIYMIYIYIYMIYIHICVYICVCLHDCMKPEILRYLFVSIFIFQYLSMTRVLVIGK